MVQAKPSTINHKSTIIYQLCSSVYRNRKQLEFEHRSAPGRLFEVDHVVGHPQELMDHGLQHVFLGAMISKRFFKHYLVGGWALPLWKMMEWKSVGMMILNWMEKIKNDPNHQPVMINVHIYNTYYY